MHGDCHIYGTTGHPCRCVEKDLEIAQLREEVDRLWEQLRKEGFGNRKEAV